MKNTEGYNFKSNVMNLTGLLMAFTVLKMLERRK